MGGLEIVERQPDGSEKVTGMKSTVTKLRRIRFTRTRAGYWLLKFWYWITRNKTDVGWDAYGYWFAEMKQMQAEKRGDYSHILDLEGVPSEAEKKAVVDGYVNLVNASRND